MNRLLLAFLVPALLGWGGAGRAQVTPPQKAPVDRAVAVAQAYVAAHPDNGEAHFTLARIHYLAFVRGEREVPVLEELRDGEKPAIADDAAIAFDLYEARQKRASELALKDIGERGPRPSAEKASAFEEARGRRARQLEQQDWYPRGEATTTEALRHAVAALEGFRAATRLDPKNVNYALGLGLLQEKVVRWLAVEKPPAVHESLRKITTATARESCLRAFRLALPADAALPARPAGGLAGLVSYQAGEAYLRMTEGVRPRIKASDANALDEVRRGLRRLKELPISSLPF